MLNVQDIPGYRDAIQREAMIRDAAFLGVNESIAGFDAAPLTLRRWLILRVIESPFIFGGTPTPVDLAQFLWVVNPDYNPSGVGRQRFLKQCAKRFMPPAEPVFFATKRWRRRVAEKIIEASKVIVAARKYVEESFIDRPGSSPGYNAPMYSDAAGICSRMAKDYGFDDNATLDKPLKRIFEYMKREDAIKGVPVSRWDDRFMNDYLSKGKTN